MREKTVNIQLKGDTETAEAPMQRRLYRRRDEDESKLFMPDGSPAGRLWLSDLDDLVGTKR